MIFRACRNPVIIKKSLFFYVPIKICLKIHKGTVLFV